MKNYIILTLFLVNLMLFSSCNNDNKQELNQKQVDIDKVQKDDNNTNTKNIATNSNIKLIEPEKLAEFLPNSIPKAEKYPSNSGFQIWNDKKFSSASSEYVFKPGGIVIIITDYGSYNNIPYEDLQLIKKYSQQQEGNIQKLILPDGVGYQRWDEVTESGMLEALIFNRIIVKIEGIRLEEKNRNLSDFYYFINTKSLQKEINKL
ncbi:MAG: hypothetical protein N2319_10540 [Candidatus Kapabacteria bacterium]|nr:hypothetical protein [Candidatus Kapabacteria bacterium]